MGKLSEIILPAHKDFIEKQHLFFVGTAPVNKSGHLNISPKGLDSFKVLDEHTVAYMDLIGSGNETAAHLLENGRITFMFCSFDSIPNILRLYGKGIVVLRNTKEWENYSKHFKIYTSTRQIIVATIDLVQTSCGYGIPQYEFISNREIHFDWAAHKGTEGLKEYIKEKNTISLDGLPTGFGKDN